MPPQLALLLTSVFVLGLLWAERRQSRDVSAASWIPTVWLMLVSSKPLGIWFGLPGDNETGSQLDRVVLTALAVMGAAVLLVRWNRWAEALRGNGWLLALLAYMLVSTFWSDISVIALKRWSRQAIILIMALVLVSEAHRRRALESLLRRSAYVLIPFSLMLVKYFPALGVDYAAWSGLRMWVGVTLHKNSLSAVCMVAALFLLWTAHRRWREGAAVVRSIPAAADVSVLLLALFLLNGEDEAYSATSVVALGVALSTLGLLAWLRRRGFGVPLAAVLALVTFLIGFGAAAPFLGGSNVAVFSSTLGRDETLTGRTETWAELVPVFKSQPLFGCGFGSFWTTARREYYRMSHAHNGYLDTMLELGILGFSFYVAWLVSCARRLHGALADDYDWAGLGLCLLPMQLLYNTAESAFSSLSNQLTAVLVLVSVVVPPLAPSLLRRSTRQRASQAGRPSPAGPSPARSPLDAGEASQSGTRRRRGQRRNAAGTTDSGRRGVRA